MQQPPQATTAACNNRCLQGYRVHIHMEKSWGTDKLPAPTLSFWCFVPGMAMRMLSALQLRRWVSFCKGEGCREIGRNNWGVEGVKLLVPSISDFDTRMQ